MTGTQTIFSLLAATIVIFSILTVTSRRILRSAIFLLFVLVAMAGLFYMMDYEFLAAVQLILYAGGVVVLIIFSILLTSQINTKLDPPKIRNLIPGLITGLFGISLSVATFLAFTFQPSSATPVDTDMKVIGAQLLDTQEQGYALPFEVISILLLAALVGAIFIARKTR
jgi:NADH-quinone oxidoreductase subunit J